LNKEAPKRDSTTLEAERKRLIKAQADREELESDKRRGELIHFSTVVDIITSVVSLVTSRLEGVAGGGRYPGY
jgi:phage terminase Nu1 subunit (DNA packaging protein)